MEGSKTGPRSLALTPAMTRRHGNSPLNCTRFLVGYHSPNNNDTLWGGTDQIGNGHSHMGMTMSRSPTSYGPTNSVKAGTR